MIKQRLINCDFLNVGGFTDNLSNKAKLLYFYFLTNADDKGFVGNGVSIANSLDNCEQNFENVLFTYRYVDALNELVERSLVYEFIDKYKNRVFLIRHWFFHNKQQKFFATNYVSFLSRVELVNNEYVLKTIKERNPLLKEKNITEMNITKHNVNNIETIKNNKESDNWEDDWNRTLKELNELKG